MGFTDCPSILMKKNDLEKWEGKLETDVKSNQLKSFLNTNWFVRNVY